MVMIIPVYQAELCHPSIRGRVTALQQFMLGIGALCAAWISWGALSPPLSCRYCPRLTLRVVGSFVGFASDDNRQWRVSLGIQNIPAAILGLLILFFPESPRWLIDHGQTEKGLLTLARLHSNGDVNDPWVQAEFSQIQESISSEHENAAQSYAELFRDKSCFRRLFLACAIQAATQMTGVSAIQYYSVAIYSKIGIAEADTLQYQAISSCLALVAQFLVRLPLLLLRLA